MLKRLLIAIPVTIAALAVIDWSSQFLIVRPCLIETIVNRGSHEQPKKDKAQYSCAYQGGIITEGIYFVASWKPETWTSVGTIVIAIFTTVLGVFTISVARSTRLAAEAAKDTIVAERPRLALSTLLFSNPIDPNERPFAVIIGFTNYGNATARVVDFCIERFIGRDTELPENPIYNDIRTTSSYPIFVAKGTEYIFRPQTIIDDLGSVLDINTGERLFVYGFICYLDHLDKRHDTGFIGWWNWMGQGFGGFPDELISSGKTFVIGRVKNYTYDT